MKLEYYVCLISKKNMKRSLVSTFENLEISEGERSKRSFIVSLTALLSMPTLPPLSFNLTIIGAVSYGRTRTRLYRSIFRVNTGNFAIAR